MFWLSLHQVFQLVLTFPTTTILDKILGLKMSILEMPMVSHQLSRCNSPLKIRLIFALNTTSHHFLFWLHFTNFWGMVQESYWQQSLSSRVLWMDNKSPHFTARMKHGTVCSERLLPLMKNARLIRLDFICLYSKMFNKFYCLLLPSNKDGTSSTFNGMILLLAAWKDLFILTLMVRNGCKLMLEPLMLFWKCLKNKAESLK